MQVETSKATSRTKKGGQGSHLANGKLEEQKPEKKAEPIRNTSGIHPFEFKVLVIPDEFQNVSKGGIIIPDTTVDMEKRAVFRGILVDMSPTAFSYEKWPEGTRIPKQGDRVLFGKYAGTSITSRVDGKEYRVLNDKDIIAILDEDA